MAKSKELGVSDLAKYMKKSPATIRGLLRKKKSKKSGKAYSWGSASAMQAEAKRLGHSSRPAKKAKSSTASDTATAA